MKLKLWLALLIVTLAVAGCASERSALESTGPGRASGLIWVADMGRGRVLVTDERSGLEGAKDFWAPAEASDLTAEQKALFPADEMNECKPAVFKRQRALLVTAWPSGFAVVRTGDRKVLFAAATPKGVHSAEALPDGTLVTVSSTGGDALRIYSTTTGYTADYPLTGGHGAVWDRQRKCLWALGTSEIKRYEYNFDKDKPALKLVRTYALPAEGGHDLYPRARREELFVTTKANVWTFSPDDGRFAPFGPLADTASVKSIGEKHINGRVLYTTWGDRLLFAHPQGVSASSGASIYKARWDRLPEFTYGYPAIENLEPGFPTGIRSVPMR